MHACFNCNFDAYESELVKVTRLLFPLSKILGLDLCKHSKFTLKEFYPPVDTPDSN